MQYSSPIRKWSIIFALFLLFPVAVFSQSDEQEDISLFHHFNTEQGLPFDAINCLVQDRKGYLWIGTAKGLCRYDGSRMLNFVNNPADKNSISDNTVQSLSLDPEGNVWAGTFYGGLNKYMPLGNQFKRFANTPGVTNLLPNNTVYSSNWLDSFHVLLTQGDLSVLDIRSGKSEIIQLPQNTWSDKFENKTSAVFSSFRMTVDHLHKWWITGEAGLLVYDPQQRKFSIPQRNKELPASFLNYSTWDSKEDSDGNIWIASGTGLFEYNRSEGRYIQHYPDRFKEEDCKSDWVKSVLCDNGIIWFGTNNGLFRYNPVTGAYTVYRNDPLQSSSVSNNSINCLYKDRQGILWIGTANGLNAIYPGKNLFHVFRNIPGVQHSIQSNITGGSFEDENGNIWVGTDHGLECIEEGGKFVSHFKYFDKRLKDPNTYHVLQLLKEGDHAFWVATWGAGLQLFDYRQRKFIESYVTFSTDPVSICSNFIKSLTRDASGQLWIATWNGGVDRLNPITRLFTHYNTQEPCKRMPSDYIGSILFNGKKVFAACRKGLLVYNAASDSFQFVNSFQLSSAAAGKIIINMDCDDSGNLWIGTTSGVIKLTAGEGKVEVVPVGNVSVSGVYWQKGILWFATDQGLKKYNPLNGQLDEYKLKDGLPVSYFPGDCFFSASSADGFFVNSGNGLIRVYPGKLIRNRYVPDMSFTYLKIANVDLLWAEDTGRVQKVSLNYDQNYITIGFAAFNFINPSLNQYMYKLDGIDKTWVNANNRNEVVYTNLRPGDYEFHVKASNDAGIWNDQGISLKIHISRPWWQTWWFYASCLIAFVSLVYLVYQIRVRRLMAEQELRNKIARDLHDDIGSTLSGVKLFSSMALQKLKDEKSDAVMIVERIGERSERMIDAMSDIVWNIHPRNDQIENVVVRMRQYAAEMLEPQNISIQIAVSEKALKGKLKPAVRKEIYLIFKEAVNNIVKHARCTAVEIELKQLPGMIQLTISDNGVGYQIDNGSSQGNGLFNMRERAKAIGATVQYQSETGSGTKVIVSFPFQKHHLIRG